LQLQEYAERGSIKLNMVQIECLVLLQILFNYQPTLKADVVLPSIIEEFMGRDVVSIELMWNGVIQERFFPVPAMCQNLSEASKTIVVQSVDRQNSEIQLGEFATHCKSLYFEVKHQERLKELGISQIFSRANQSLATWITFYIAVLVNGLYCIYIEYPTKPRAVDAQGPSTLVDDVSFVQWKLHNEGPMMLDVVVMMDWLNIGQIALSAFTFTLFLIVRVPVVFALHYRQYRKPLLVSLVYTLLSWQPWYYALYVVCALLGKHEPRLGPVFHALLLLDIIVKDPTTADVLRSVWYPKRALAATVFLMMFIMYIFAVFTFLLFPDEFLGDDSQPFCRNLRDCFAATVSYGLRNGGGFGDIMGFNQDGLERERFWLELLFFLFVLVILMNIVFGIIIDTFSELRDQKKEKRIQTTKACFICGLEDNMFEKMGRGFAAHIREDHRMWNYFYFMVYLWEQDQDHDDGLEYYVRHCLLENDHLRWFPVGTAYCIEKKAQEEKEEEGQGMLDDVRSLDAKLEKLCAAQAEQSARQERLEVELSDRIDTVISTLAQLQISSPANAVSPGWVQHHPQHQQQ